MCCDSNLAKQQQSQQVQFWVGSVQLDLHNWHKVAALIKKKKKPHEKEKNFFFALEHFDLDPS